MKLFAMLMLRCALVMILSSFIQNGTLAVLDEWNEFQKWSTQCQEMIIELFKAVEEKPLDHPNYINEVIMKRLTDLLNVVNNFPVKGMEKLLNRRLQKPLKMAISNCKKILNEVEQSGQEDNNKYLEMLSSKTHSITKRIETEFNTFIMEVVLELIEKVNWTSGNNIELGNKFYNFWASSLAKESYCENDSFGHVVIWTRENKSPRSEQDVEDLQTLIFEAKLRILEFELYEKIAEFAKQKKQIDVDGFMEFPDEFKDEWKQIEQQIIAANIVDKKIANTEKTLRERLDELAEIAMKETARLKTLSQNSWTNCAPGDWKSLAKKPTKV